MDRARPYTTVKDFDRRTPQEVEYRDAVYAHQILLNEARRPAEVTEVVTGLNPAAAAAGKGMGGVGQRGSAAGVGAGASSSSSSSRPWAAPADDAEAAKFVTETWDEYAIRVQQREANLNRYFSEKAATDAAEEARKASRAALSAAAVDTLMQHQVEYNAKHYRPCQHTLRTDYEAITADKMRLEREALEAAELKAREKVAKAEEAPARRAVEVEAAKSFQHVLDAMEEQRQRRLSEERRRVEEQRAKEEAKRREEEQRKAAEAAAELHRRQQEAEAKQLEQKRRNDERKAKARAEREQRSRANRNSVHGSGVAAGVNAPSLEGLDMTFAGQTVSLAGMDTMVTMSTPRTGSAGVEDGQDL